MRNVQVGTLLVYKKNFEVSYKYFVHDVSRTMCTLLLSKLSGVRNIRLKLTSLGGRKHNSLFSHVFYNVRVQDVGGSQQLLLFLPR